LFFYDGLFLLNEQHNGWLAGWLAGSTMLSFNSLISNYWKQIKLPPIHQYFLGKNITPYLPKL
jgi:hypothetical protein